MAAVRAADNNRHSAPREVERHLVDLGVFLGSKFAVEVNMVKDGLVQQVPQTRLEMTVEEGISQNVVGFLAKNVEVPFKDDPVLRQRTGLVDA